MTGLEDPKIAMELNGRIPLAAIYQFLGENITDGSGFLNIEALTLNGKLEDMMSMYRVPRVKLNGVINMEEARLVSNEVNTTVKTGKMTLANNTFNVANFLMEMPNNHILLNGNFENVLPVLLSD